KSGKSIVFPFLATDCSLNTPTALHAAASYTSSSSGKPLRRQSIVLQSMIKSIPPCPPTSLAMVQMCFTIGGEYFSYRSFSSCSLIHSCPNEILSGSGYLLAHPLVPLSK